MSVIAAHSVGLEVDDLDVARRFYTDAGLIATQHNDRIEFACYGHTEPSIVVLRGSQGKRLQYIALQADLTDRENIEKSVKGAGGEVRNCPVGFPDDDLWVRDPHGMSVRLTQRAIGEAKAVSTPFAINQPGSLQRLNRGAIPPRSRQPKVRPLKLGHILVFTPDVSRSISFLVDGLGMGLADKAQDVIAFCCARKNSDHHVVALAKSPGIGFHHASFLVNDPDEVGRAGAELCKKSSGGNWGFGRHTIGSNFFHYVQDPWGSWFEYYSDMDYIQDHSHWTPSDYALEDSLANWGPDLPNDFVHNYEYDDIGYRAPQPTAA